MASNKVNKGFRYYMKFENGHDTPVNGTVKLLRKPPRDGSIWRDVTPCLYLCCQAGTLTAEDFDFALTTATDTDDVITLASAVSSIDDAIIVSEYHHTVDGVKIDIDSNGTVTFEIVDDTENLTATIEVPIKFSDLHGDSVTVIMTVNVSYTA